METNPTQRFSDRVDNYVNFRPSYPPQILDFMKENLGLKRDSIIVDVGSGTGLSLKIFLDNGNQVYAVEPNEAMRKAAEKSFGAHQTFHSRNGTSENTGLQNQFADFIIAAQAFHWFEPKETKKEFDRILKTNGRIALIWNDRKTKGSPFAEEYEALITLFGTDYCQVKHKNIGDDRIRDFLGPFEVRHFANTQDLDYKGLLGRLASSSYAPTADHPRYAEMCTALKFIFDRHQRDGLVRFEYDTQVYYSVSRPECIKHYSEIQEGPESSFYRGTREYLSIGSPFSKVMGLNKLGIHHVLLPPGRRSSWPHAESAEEEFAYVVEGNPDVWINGHLHRLSPGEAVGFPSGTGISHTFINNTDANVRLLVVGETSKSENKIYYPLNPTRREQCKDSWWNDVPKHNHGPHDGLPDKLRGSEALGPLNLTGEIIVESLHDQSVLDSLECYRIKSRRSEMPDEAVKVWNINRYCLDETALMQAIPVLEQSIGPGGWYIHFYSDVGNKLFVIFKGKHFVISKTKDHTWNEMIDFGESIGVGRRWTETIPVRFTDNFQLSLHLLTIFNCLLNFPFKRPLLKLVNLASNCPDLTLKH
jgi:uncharacterized cupin superfamily protein/SAM-dependent methyltransferase